MKAVYFCIAVNCCVMLLSLFIIAADVMLLLLLIIAVDVMLINAELYLVMISH